MSLADRIRWFRKRAEGRVERRLPARVPITPDYLQLEIINRCNLRCVMCSISELTRARKRRYLDVAGFEAIASQFPALKRVDLQGIGEPLLNPHLEEIVSWCRQRSIEVGFVTNGLLFDEDRIESVLRSEPSFVIFSVDSVDPEVFDSIRPGAELAKILANIRALLDARRRLGLSSPHIGVMSVVMKQNLPTIPDLVRAAAELGVDGLTIKGLNPRPNPELEERDTDPARREIELAMAEFPDLPVTLAFANDRSRLRCRWPWAAAYVTVEGDMTPCCNCPDQRDLGLGNLLDTPLAKLWNGPAYRRFRRELRDEMPAICRKCPDY
jgi:MoaA/NifB/PqqE/SkfB family radical SAM enzyme